MFVSVDVICRPLVSFDQSFHSCSFLAGNKLNVCQTSVSSLCRLLNVPCRYITAQLFGKAHPLLCLMAAFTLFQKEFRLPQPQKSWVWFTSRSRQSLQHVRWVVSCVLLISGVMKIQKDPSFKGLDRLFLLLLLSFFFLLTFWFVPRLCVRFLSRLSWLRWSSRTACVRVWWGSVTRPSGSRRNYGPASKT